MGIAHTRRWRAAVPIGLALLLGASGLGVPRSLGAPSPGPVSQARDPLAIDLPDDPAFRKPLDLKGDAVRLHELVDELREKHGLPVRLAPNLEGRASRVTVRFDAVDVEAALRAIALSLGDDYRWRRVGSALVLTRVAPARRWAAALTREEVAELRRGLMALGLLLPGEDPVADSRNRPGARTGPGRSALGQTARELADGLVAALPPALAERAAAPGGLPVAALPRALQEKAYALVTSEAQNARVQSARLSVTQLLMNPVIAGRPPDRLRVVSRNGAWHLRYSPYPGWDVGLTLSPR